MNLFLESAVNHLDLHWARCYLVSTLIQGVILVGIIRSLDETRRRERHIVVDLGNHRRVVDGARLQRHWHQHHLVPVRMLVHPVGILLLALQLGIMHLRNQVTDIIEGISVLLACRGTVGCRIRRTVVRELALLEEGIQAISLYHQNGGRSAELILAVFYIIHSRE